MMSHDGKGPKWHLTLDKYQRDNLLWLLNACGYPGGDAVPPFTHANTGDWLGEVALMLARPGEPPIITSRDSPNHSFGTLREWVQHWVKHRPTELTDEEQKNLKEFMKIRQQEALEDTSTCAACGTVMNRSDLARHECNIDDPFIDPYV